MNRLNESHHRQASGHDIDQNNDIEALNYNSGNNPLSVLSESMRNLYENATNGVAETEIQEIRSRARSLLRQSPRRPGEMRIGWIEKNDRQGYVDFFEGLLGLSSDQWRNEGWLTHVAHKSPDEGGIGFSLSGICRAIIKRFSNEGGWRGFLNFMDGREAGTNPLFEKVKSCRKPGEFQAWFKEIGIDFESPQWREADWWKENGQHYRWHGASLKMIWSAIRHDERFPTWGIFLAFMDNRVGNKTYLSFAKAVDRCRNPLDFIIYFTDLGIPENNWENSEWLSSRSHNPISEGGIDKKLSGLVGAIRGDERWSGSYPKFVAWMYGKSKPDQSISQRVREFITPLDAINLLQELEIPPEIWTNSEALARLAQERSNGGRGKSNKIGIYGFLQAAVDRYGGWPEYVAWFEGKERAEETWFQKIEKCKTREEFLVFFEEQGLTLQQWRNSHWLGKNRKGLLHALMYRFNGKFTIFLAWMDGLPLGGISSLEEADSIIRCESMRLKIDINNLLSREKIMKSWRRTPATISALEYYAKSLSMSEVGNNAIEGHMFYNQICINHKQALLTKNAVSRDERIQGLLTAFQDKYQIALEGKLFSTAEEVEATMLEMFAEEDNLFRHFNIPTNVQRTIRRLRNHARIVVEEAASWKQPLRVHHRITKLGNEALKFARVRLGLTVEEGSKKRMRQKKEPISKQESIKGIPCPPELLISDIAAFECACGTTLENMGVQDTTKYLFTSGERKYKESPMLFFLRVGNNILGKGTKRVGAFGRSYLIQVRDGASHEDAVKNIKAGIENPPAQLPNPPMLTSEHIKAFETASGISVKDFTMNDRRQYTFTFSGQKYCDSPRKLLNRLKKILTEETVKKVLLKHVVLYLALILDGDSHEAAKRQILLVKKQREEIDDGLEDTAKGIRILDPENITLDHIHAFEIACGFCIEEMRLNDAIDRTFNVNGRTYCDSPQAFLYRVSEALGEDGKGRSVGKKFITLIKSGIDQAEARQIVLQEVASEEEKSQLRLPKPPFLTEKHVRAFEMACRCSVEDMSASDIEDRIFTVDDSPFQDNPRFLLHRIARLVADNAMTGDVGKQYLILIRNGLDDEQARKQVLQQLSEAELARLPPLPTHPNLTSIQIKAFEDAWNRRLEDIPVVSNDRKIFAVDGATFSDTMQTLCYRVCRYALDIQGNLKVAARNYLILLRDGIDPEEAKTKIRQSIEASIGLQPMPNPPDLSADHVRAIELATGKSVETFSVGDQRRIRFSVDAQMYEDSQMVLLGRIMRSIAGKDAGRAALGKIYLAMIRDGASHDTAKEATLIRLAEAGPDSPQLPVPPELTIEHIRAIEEAHRRPLELISVHDNKLRTITVGEQSFEDSIHRLLDRVVRSMKSGKTSLGTAKRYLIFLRDGMTYSDAISRIISERDSRLQKHPVLPSPPNLTANLLKQFEAACDNTPIADMSVNDKIRRLFDIEGKTYYESPAAFFMRLARKIMGRKDARSSIGKIYAIHIRDGVSHQDALNSVLVQLEGMSERYKRADGLSAKDITSTKQAREILLGEAERLGIPLNELLQPSTLRIYKKQSPAIRAVLDFFAKNTS